jgi:outer membrane protein assembly factor BamD
MFGTQRTTRSLIVVVIAGLALLSSCGRKKYDNVISKDTQQPDKLLFDRAINDIERSRYEIARLTLQTLINTYDTSEFLAKAKLAIADSWMREGGSHALAQAEAEYKDFILFYPTMEEAAEAQEKICNIHYRQMEKPDRDSTHALRAEDECRQLLQRFPNSKFAPIAQQKLREVQEVIAEGEYRAGAFYFTKGSFPAAANRFQALVDQYPLFSKADEALWKLGDAYTRFGDRYEDKAAVAYTRIVRDYPLSPFAENAKQRLSSLNRPIPEADPVAYARMKYEIENRDEPGMMSHFWGMFQKSPDVSLAAKSGTPAMTSIRPSVPASVPTPGSTQTGVSADVSVAPVTDSTALDTQPDARQNPPAAAAGAPAEQQPAATASPENAPLPTNHQAPPRRQQKKDDKKNGR